MNETGLIKRFWRWVEQARNTERESRDAPSADPLQPQRQQAERQGRPEAGGA